jgi:DNA mismatch repair protein MutS
MLQQYFRAKEEHPGVLLAMRVGDFYEFYGEDAEKAASVLEITLTGREDGGNGKIAMAGVPFHSVEKYLARLLANGIKVALCDQLEDPKTTKGLIKRGVTRVLTPGTVMEDTMLPAGQNNFLAAICVMDGKAGLATLDPSTGEFVVTEIEGEQLEEKLLQELARLRPTELLTGPKAESFGEIARVAMSTSVTDCPQLSPERAARKLLEQFEVTNLQGFGVQDKPSAVIAASMILGYAEKNRLSLDHVESLTTYSVDGFMGLDLATRRSLELSQNMSDGGRRHTLLSVLDETRTAMGSRLMRKWIEQPLLDIPAIKSRQEAVERLLNHGMVRGDIREGLKRVSDVERLVSRVATGFAGPRDLAALKVSLFALPHLAEPLRKVGLGRIQELRELISDHSDIAHLLDRALVNEPPHSVREGGLIKEGHDPELDKLRDLSRNGKAFIAKLEQQERERTGISGLKVGYTAVFGYYLEVTRSQLEKVPADYIRKQTIANAERFITAELKEHESHVLNAEEKATSLEGDLFYRLRIRVAEHTRVLLQTARALAELDVLCSLAEVAAIRGYVKPSLVESDVLEIELGRHPVVEASTVRFVPNDLFLGDSRQSIVDGGDQVESRKSKVEGRIGEADGGLGIGDSWESTGDTGEAPPPLLPGRGGGRGERSGSEANREGGDQVEGRKSDVEGRSRDADGGLGMADGVSEIENQKSKIENQKPPLPPTPLSSSRVDKFKAGEGGNSDLSPLAPLSSLRVDKVGAGEGGTVDSRRSNVESRSEVESRMSKVESRAEDSAIENRKSKIENSPRSRVIILTGPNMSGKSTYLRQTAMIVLMAQIGSFVPAKSCRLGLCDRIFARIGAKDELALGQSTFMVEMVESANILNHATTRSLVILDEVGRGTSTYDGLAIAWAMVEYLTSLGAKTMFATHYHQLNALADQLPTVANYRVSVEEIGDDIVWTHRVLAGGTDRSYGIHVARMAGVPSAVLVRSSEILAELEKSSVAPSAVTKTEKLQMTLFEFDEPPVIKELQNLDVNTLTPLEALRLLDDWKKRFSG